MAFAHHMGIRSLGRGTVGGVFMTLLIHGALGYAVYVTQIKAPPPMTEERELITTQMVTLGKPREKFWLPKKVQPPPPKMEQPVIRVAEDPNAEPAPKEPPKLEDATISKDLRRALQRVRNLQQANVPEEDPEGSPTGSALGTSSEASVGDEYATKVFDAVRRNWNAPTLIDEATLAKLSTSIVVRIDGDGTLLDPQLRRPSGNDIYDDSCMQAIKATGKVPPPPPEVAAKFKRGVNLAFEAKNLR
jgi:TonB family protein